MRVLPQLRSGAHRLPQYQTSQHLPPCGPTPPCHTMPALTLCRTWLLAPPSFPLPAAATAPRLLYCTARLTAATPHITVTTTPFPHTPLYPCRTICRITERPVVVGSETWPATAFCRVAAWTPTAYYTHVHGSFTTVTPRMVPAHCLDADCTYFTTARLLHCLLLPVARWQLSPASRVAPARLPPPH